MKRIQVIFFCMVLGFKVYANPRLVSILHQRWDWSIWQNQSLQTYYYDSNNVFDTINRQIWVVDSNKWILSSLTVSTNNPDGTKTKEVMQLWEPETQMWENDANWLYNYTSTGKAENITSQFWQFADWQNQDRLNYEYDANGFLISTRSEFWNGNRVWENSVLTTYTNNANGTIDHTEEQHWDYTVNRWLAPNTTTYKNYGVNGKISASQINIWVSGMWQNRESDTFIYNGYGQVITNAGQEWLAAKQQWVKSWQTLYSYNHDGTLDNVVKQFWDTTFNVWQNSEKYTYAYLPAALVQDTGLSTELYPNPARNSINLNVADQRVIYEISLFDITGKLLWIMHYNVGNQLLDISNLAAGVYLLRITHGNATIMQKFVKE